MRPSTPKHVDEPDLRADCFRYAATTFARTGKPERETFRRSGNRIGEANVYRNMAHRLVMSPDERIRLARESVALAREAGDQPSLAVMLHGLAVVLQWTESFDEVLTALAECALIIADMPGLAYLEPLVLHLRSTTLAGCGRLEESVDEASRALDLTRHQGDIPYELPQLLSDGDALIALGRTRQAAETWRRFLALATSPELVQHEEPVTPFTDGAEIIDRVRAKPAALIDNSDL